MCILDFNYARLSRYLRMLVDQHIRIFNIRPNEIRLIEESEYPVALQFFLQFDGKHVYLWCCSYRMKFGLAYHFLIGKYVQHKNMLISSCSVSFSSRRLVLLANSRGMLRIDCMWQLCCSKHSI
jgi:hypothetical protein